MYVPSLMKYLRFTLILPDLELAHGIKQKAFKSRSV